MDQRMPLLSGILLVFLMQLQGAWSSPIYDLSPSRELDNLKNILERLEEKFSLMEALESSPDQQEPGVQGGLQVDPSEVIEGLQSEPRVSPAGPYSFKDSLLRGLRSFQNAKMMRDSGCFGRRIDRIGSMSGMGCNGPRKN
ncbi:natriuretic peptides A-like [Ambystoma mexicanum]|uniref:natriuretic peptides A-like n=1 Tax=Ambystoma mexicanum TaxID=8296 RepID=UPI0037E98FB8